MTVEVTSDTVTPALAEAVAKLTDPTRLFQDIGEFLLASTGQNFADGSAPDGTAWAPRAQATLDAYASRKPPFRPSGGPLIGESRSLSTTIAYQIDGDAITWGSNMIYAAVQHFGAAQGEFGEMANGSPIPWGDIPPRPFLGLGPDDEAGILDIIAEYMAPD